MNKRKKVNLIFSLISVVLSSLLLIVVVLGWYTSNENVSVSSISGTTGTLSTNEKYYLGTSGSTPYSDSSKNFFDWLFKKTPTTETYTTSDNKTVNLYTTKNDKEISWNLSALSNLDNTGDSIGIQPSSYGQLQFYVIPTNTSSETLTVKLNLNFTGYKEKDDEETPYEESESASQTKAKKHILFFREYSNKQYNNWIDDSDVTVNIENPVQNRAYLVTLYWIWPSVLSQLLLKDGNQYLYGRKCILSSEAQTKVTKDMKDNYLSWFTRNNNSSFTLDELTEASKDISNLSVSNVTDSFKLSNYKILNSAYNNADQQIGDYINYLKVELRNVANE